MLCVQISIDSQIVCSCGDDKTVHLWNGGMGSSSQIMWEHSGNVYTVALNANVSRMYSRIEDRFTREWDVASGECLQTLLSYTGLMRSMFFFADENSLYLVSKDKTVDVWDTKEGVLVRQMEGHTKSVMLVCKLPGGNILSRSLDNTIKMGFHHRQVNRCTEMAFELGIIGGCQHQHHLLCQL